MYLIGSAPFEILAGNRRECAGAMTDTFTPPTTMAHSKSSDFSTGWLEPQARRSGGADASAAMRLAQAKAAGG
jgi:hypothetical protein